MLPDYRVVVVNITTQLSIMLVAYSARITTTMMTRSVNWVQCTNKEIGLKRIFDKKFHINISEAKFSDWGLMYLLWIALRYMSLGLDVDVNNDSGNGFVPSGTKPLPASMLAEIYFAMWCL